MVQFGDELRLEREHRGVSLETMHAHTKLSLRHLRDVEAGNFCQLPGGIFRKGFVRSYLRALGLDEPVWLERFEASYRASGLAGPEDADWASFAENVRNNRRGGRGSSTRLKWIGVLAMTVLLVVLGIFVWKRIIEPKLPQRGEPGTSLSLGPHGPSPTSTP
jgi:cytoskeletal protein RodZ